MPSPKKKIVLTPEQQAILNDYNTQMQQLQALQTKQQQWQALNMYARPGRLYGIEKPVENLLRRTPGLSAAYQQAGQVDLTSRMVQAELNRLKADNPWVEAWSDTGRAAFEKSLSQRVASGEMKPEQAQAEYEVFLKTKDELVGTATEEAATGAPSDYSGSYGSWAAALKDKDGTQLIPALDWNLMTPADQEYTFRSYRQLPGATTEDKTMTEYQREQIRLANEQLRLDQQAAERQAAAAAAGNQMTDYQRQSLAQQREQAQQQAYLQTLNAVGNFANTQQDAWGTALPWTLPEGTQYLPGFEQNQAGRYIQTTPMRNQTSQAPNMQAYYQLLQQAVSRFGQGGM